MNRWWRRTATLGLAGVFGGGLLYGIIKTRIQDTVYNANGTLAAGVMTISWIGFTAGDGSSIVGNSLTYRIINGVLNLELVPNQNATPSGTSYTVTYLLEGKRAYTEVWVVPQSAAALRLSQVRVVSPPAAPGPVGSGNIYTSGGLTGVGPTPFSPASTWEVYDATISTGVTRQILRNGAGQATNPLLSFHSGSFSIGFRAPTLSASTTYTLPPQDGVPGALLKTDGLGNLTWNNASAAVTGEFYQTFQNSGASLPQRHNANFLNGLVATDVPGSDRTEVSLGAHASRHAIGGNDLLTPSAIGALKNTSDILNTGAASNIGLIIKGASGQAASLQEWQDSAGTVLASVTSTGRVYFPEAFFVPRPAETATSLFFQISNLNRFAMTTFANALNFNRYDDAGNFKDVALQLVRAGDTSINTSLLINDPTATTGLTRLRVKAGAGQGTANLQEWQNSAGAVLSSVDSSGFFQFPAAQKQGNGTKVQHFSGASPATDSCAKFDVNGNVVSTGAPCGTGAATMALQLGDFHVTRTSSTVLTIGANCTVSLPCNVRFGNVTYSFTASATATLSAGTGTAYVYVAQDGALTVGHNVTLTCSGCTAQSSVTSFPSDSAPLFNWTATSAAWDAAGGTDRRAFLSAKNITAGQGIAATEASGRTTVAIDTAVVPTFEPGGAVPACKKYTVNESALTAAAGTEDEVLFNLPARGKLVGINVKTSTAFAGAGITAVTVSIGDSSSPTFYTSNYDVLAAVSDTNFQDTQMFKSSTMAARDVLMRFNCTGANCNAMTAGGVDARICWVVLP